MSDKKTLKEIYQSKADECASLRSKAGVAYGTDSKEYKQLTRAHAYWYAQAQAAPDLVSQPERDAELDADIKKCLNGTPESLVWSPVRMRLGAWPFIRVA